MNHPKATTLLRIFTSVIILSLLNACATQRMNPHLSQTPDVTMGEKEFQKKTKRATLLWNKRYEQTSLVEFIALEEELSRTSRQNREQLVELSRAHFILAEYFLQEHGEQEKHWNDGASWAERALAENQAFRKKVVIGKIPADQVLSTLTRKDVDALYWFASNLGRWASRRGLGEILKYKDRVKKMLDRVRELDQNYFYAAVYRYYGVYYALLPGYTENDLKLSKRYFETALKKYPEYFSNHVLYAQYYASKIEDEALFQKHLNFVVKGNPKFLAKESYPEQLLEQARAKKLLERKP
jgi:hypothetical protein